VKPLATVIVDFLRDAEAGGRYTREELRELRGALTHVSSELGAVDVGAVEAEHVHTLLDQLRAAGLPPQRVEAIVGAMRSVYAYAAGRGLVATSPLVGLAAEVAGGPSPTTAMLALGERLVTWVMWAIALGFLLAAAGLAVALA
jgi:site-specific recombinase XerC